MSKNGSQLKNFILDSNNSATNNFTHTVMPGSSIPAKALHIKDLELFYKIYYKHVFKLGLPAHITEAPDSNGTSQVKVDIDLKYNSSELVRLYDDELLQNLIRYHYREIKNWVIDLSDDERLVFIFEKTKPIWDGKETKWVKDGIHLMMPYLITPWLLQSKIREEVIKQCKENNLFEKFELRNKITDIIDKAIIYKNNWLLYGSSKCNKEPYLLTKVFKWNDDDSLEVVPIKNERWTNKKLIRLLSIRNKTDVTLLKPNKQLELEEELQQIIIKKQKVHAPININEDSEVSNLSDADLEYVFGLIDCLDISRATDYQKWSEMIWCCHNIHNTDNRLLKKVIEFSKKSEKYKFEAEDACCKFWDKSKSEGGLGMGSLKYWANLDNPDQYNKVNDNSILKVVNKLIYGPGGVINLNSCDISDILKILYDNTFKCTSCKNGEWYQFENHKWTKLDSPVKLRQICKSKIHQLYLDKVKDFKIKKIQEQNEKNMQNAMNDNEQATTNNNDVKQLNQKMTALYQKLNKLRDTTFLNLVLKEAQNDFYDLSQNFLQDLNEKRNLICFNNGVFDLDKIGDNPFREGRPEDKQSFCTNIDYVPLELHNPEQRKIHNQIQNFLRKILPKKDVREYTLKLLSSFLHGSTKNEQFHFWTGTGGNGKSKLVELFELCIGDYASKLSISLLTQKRSSSSSADPEVAQTKGKRFINMQEPSAGARINAGLLKELTGGDTIITRALYKDTFQFKPQFKIILCCNDVPYLPHNDQGVWRRVRVTEFISQFIDDPDPMTKELPLEHPDNPLEFKKEPVDEYFQHWKEVFMSMLLNTWYPLYKRDGLNEPDDVIKYTRKIQEENDTVKKFWSKMIVSADAETHRLTLREAYRSYKDWMMDDQGKKSKDIMSSDKFKKEVDNNLKKLNKKRYNDPQRIKKDKKGKTLLGKRADGWWGFKFREDCCSDDEDENETIVSQFFTNDVEEEPITVSDLINNIEQENIEQEQQETNETNETESTPIPTPTNEISIEINKNKKKSEYVIVNENEDEDDDDDSTSSEEDSETSDIECF